MSMNTSPTQNYQIFEECSSKSSLHHCCFVKNKLRFKDVTKANPLFRITEPQVLHSTTYAGLTVLHCKKIHGSLTAVLITRKHRFCDRTHSERDPKWQTTSALNKHKGKPVSLPSALVTSQKASSEMWKIKTDLGTLSSSHQWVFLHCTHRATKTKFANMGTFPNTVTATLEDKAQKDGHLILQLRWYILLVTPI